MGPNLIISFLFFVLIPKSVLADSIVFFETVPLWGIFVMMAVAFSIPAFLIFAHIGLFEFLHTDRFPKPPSISKAQQEMLYGAIVGCVFGALLTIVFILLS